jgi:3-hydroxyacyl-[acyl-carrier-protein] dehydratase
VPCRSGQASLFVDPAADYLEDHFPGAPMLPGLVMLEAAVRAAAAVWQAHAGSPMEGSMLDRLDRLQILRRVAPGDTLVVKTEIVEPIEDGDTRTFTAVGEAAGAIVMRARFRLRSLAGHRVGNPAGGEMEPGNRAIDQEVTTWY